MTKEPRIHGVPRAILRPSPLARGAWYAITEWTEDGKGIRVIGDNRYDVTDDLHRLFEFCRQEERERSTAELDRLRGLLREVLEWADSTEVRVKELETTVTNLARQEPNDRT